MTHKDISFCLHCVKNVVTLSLKSVDFVGGKNLTSCEKISKRGNTWPKGLPVSGHLVLGSSLHFQMKTVLCSSGHHSSHLISFMYLYYLSGSCRHLWKNLNIWVLSKTSILLDILVDFFFQFCIKRVALNLRRICPMKILEICLWRTLQLLCDTTPPWLLSPSPSSSGLPLSCWGKMSYISQM